MGHTSDAAAVVREQLLEEFSATRTLIGSLEQQQQLGASGQRAQLRQVTLVAWYWGTELCVTAVGR